MALMDQVKADLMAAMKAKDEVGKRTLRMLKSDLGKREVEVGRDLEDQEALQVLGRAVKSRKDSIAAYEEAARQDLADAEREELAVLERYLPKQLDEAEARAAITTLAQELGLSEKKQMGQLMSAVMGRLRGRIDGKLAKRLADEVLS